MTGTYVTDIRHFLDESLELADMPAEAANLAGFLVLIVDNATHSCSPVFKDTGIRCRTTGCTESILAMLDFDTEDIVWRCPACGHHGLIRNWQGTRWDNTEP
jgi:hypothetical protein